MKGKFFCHSIVFMQIQETPAGCSQRGGACSAGVEPVLWVEFRFTRKNQTSVCKQSWIQPPAIVLCVCVCVRPVFEAVVWESLAGSHVNRK